MSDLRYAVVCVDDDPYILQMLGFQLSKLMNQSYTLIEYFTDPDQALENIDVLIEEQIDVMFVMVDYQMPTMTGAELIRKLKLKYQNLKCVMLSGQANKSAVDALKTESLLEEFIEKPWDEDELFNTLRPLITAPK